MATPFAAKLHSFLSDQKGARLNEVWSWISEVLHFLASQCIVFTFLPKVDWLGAIVDQLGLLLF